MDSPNAALAKAIQGSHDFLYRAVRVLNVPINDVAIPFVVLCGGLVQFGAVYSPTQEFYPVPVLVTPPLHLYSNVRGVGRACNLYTLAHAALVTYATGRSTQTALATADGPLLRQALAAVCSESRLCAPCTASATVHVKLSNMWWSFPLVSSAIPPTMKLAGRDWLDPVRRQGSRYRRPREGGVHAIVRPRCDRISTQPVTRERVAQRIATLRPRTLFAY